VGCDTPADDDDATPAPPQVAGTVTLGTDMSNVEEVVQPEAALWVGFFLLENLDGLCLPLQATLAEFGEVYGQGEDPAPEFPFAFLMEAQQGLFYPIVGVDQNDDGLFCVDEILGKYEDPERQENYVQIVKSGLGSIDMVLDIVIPAQFEPAECQQ